MPASNQQPTGGKERRRSGYDLRHRYAWLNQFSDEELREISFCDEHAPLQDGAQYFDVSHPEQGTINGRSGQKAPEGSCYVARTDVSAATWNKLLGFGRGEKAAER